MAEWSMEDERAFWDSLSEKDRTRIHRSKVLCRSCGAEYARHLRFCPGCVEKKTNRGGLDGEKG